VSGYLEVAYPESRSDIYQSDVNVGDENDPRSIVLNYVHDGAYVLDAGCACGDLGVALKRYKQATIVGMEHDSGAIALALTKDAYEEIHQVDLNNFDSMFFEQYYGKFDYIVFGDVLEHLYEPHIALDKFKGLLKPTGSFLISFPNTSHASIKLNLLINDWTYTDAGLLDKTHIRFFTYKSIASFLADMELQIDDMQYTSFNKKGVQPSMPWKNLPYFVSVFVYSDPASFVWQYVVKATRSPSFIPRTHLFESNLSKLRIKWSLATKSLKANMRKAAFIAPLICSLRS